jgi:chromosome segregation ATPase
MQPLSLTLIEIIVLMLGAITLGITIHFFIVSRRSLNMTALNASGKVDKELQQWKLKYFNDTETRDKELGLLRQKLANSEQKLANSEENNEINSIEADEMRKQNKKLLAEMEAQRKSIPTVTAGQHEINNKEMEEMRRLNAKLQADIETLRNAKPATSSAAPGSRVDYMEQLREAQASMMEHNEKINQLLGQIDIVKETEEKQQELQAINDGLTVEINDLKTLLAQKEKEIINTRKKEHLTTEMTSRLDSAYNEFNTLQDKIQKLETQLIASKKISIDYEDLQESNYKIIRDFDDQKLKYNAAISANQQLQTELAEAESHFREAHFQRQQLQKRVAYLEELNNDMQAVAEANKKLESQLKRVGELESKLNMVAEERDELAKKQYKTL